MRYAGREKIARPRPALLVTLVLMVLAAGACASRPSAKPAPATDVRTIEPQLAHTAGAPASPLSAASRPAAPPGMASPAWSPTATSSATPTLTAAPTATATRTPTPGPTPDGVARTLRVPILMYHYVKEPPADADIYQRDNSVSPARLESHLRYLRDAGYRAVTLDDLLYGLAQGRALPDKSVILTFDDGHADNYENAFPLLQQYGVVAHFFILTDVINAGTPGYMTWAQVEEMAAAGQRFGSHARDHSLSLRGKTVDFLVWHALGGMEAITEHLGYHPRWIAYPAGEYDEQTRAVYKSAHYWGGLSTRQGATHTLDDIFELKRVRIRGSYTADDLARLLALDW